MQSGIFIQQVLEKHNIKKAKLVLRNDINVSTFCTESGHHLCEKCFYELTEQQCEILNNLPQLEEALPHDVKSTLVYIAGYIIRKDQG